MTIATQSSTSSPRGATINQLFAAWNAAEDGEKEVLGERLRNELFRFAGRMIYLIMRHENVHLQNEMVNDIWMGFSSFQGKSAFSSWAYAWFRNRCVTEWKYLNRNIGESLDSYAHREGEFSSKSRTEMAVSEGSETDSDIYLREYVSSLDPVDAKILDLRMDGLTIREIAKEIGTLGKSAVSRHLAAMPKVSA